jgi:hypothetical protein
MALKFKLNTAQIPTITQQLLAVPSGKVYDHKALEVSGTVTLLAANEADAAQLRLQKLGGFTTTTES